MYISLKDLLGAVGVMWGIAGDVLLLASAVYRISPIACGIQHALPLVPLVGTDGQCPVYGLCRRGARFSAAFSPRVAARARHLHGHPQVHHVIFAHFFCMACDTPPEGCFTGPHGRDRRLGPGGSPCPSFLGVSAHNSGGIYTKILPPFLANIKNLLV